MHRISHLIIGFAFTFLFFNTAVAQVGLSPLYRKIIVGEGGQSQTTFTVLNGSAQPIRFRATFSPFTFTDGSIELIVTEQEIQSDLSMYLRAAPLEFEVPAFSEQNIRVIALVPPSAVNNELRAALTVEPLDLGTSPKVDTLGQGVRGTVRYIYRFVAQIYAVSPEGRSEISIDNASFHSEKGLRIKLINQGTVSDISSTTWRLTQGEKTIASSDQPARYVVLPKDSRMGLLSGTLSLKPGTYTLTGTFGTEDGGEPPVVLNPQPFTKTFTVK